MIKRQSSQEERILEATCDCCGTNIMDMYGRLNDHLKIGGYRDRKLLEAIVCIKCMDEKLGFINIQRKENTIGYC